MASVDSTTNSGTSDSLVFCIVRFLNWTQQENPPRTCDSVPPQDCIRSPYFSRDSLQLFRGKTSSCMHPLTLSIAESTRRKLALVSAQGNSGAHSAPALLAWRINTTLCLRRALALRFKCTVSLIFNIPPVLVNWSLLTNYMVSLGMGKEQILTIGLSMVKVECE